jgi:histidine triad (HIT) family protein
MASIFSRIVAGEIPCYKIAETDKFLAFLDAFPRVKGHTLCIPKKEIDYIFDMEDEELAELIVFSKNIAKAVEKVVPCKRIGVAVVGIEVPHTHIHLMPINGISDFGFASPPMKVDAAEMEVLAQKIAEALENT